MRPTGTIHYELQRANICYVILLRPSAKHWRESWCIPRSRFPDTHTIHGWLMEENCTRPNPAPHPGAPHTPAAPVPPHPLFRYSRGGGFLFSMVLLACPRRVAGDILALVRIIIRSTYSLHDGHQNSAKRPSHMFPL